ncbi:MAG TPA: chemotaxis protein CheA [Terriglobales bacterium]|nr:chemotaxis protein CheA [Terriglobales bacterium]
MDFDRDAVLTSFIAETQEGLDLMEQSLLAMESSSGGAELLDDIFRVAHTLKGNATSLELDDLKGFAHATEDLLDVLREQNTEIGADVISLLLKTVDELRALVAKAATTENPRLTPEQQKLRKQIADEVTARSQRVVAPNPKAERSTPAGAAPLPGAAGRTLRIDIDKLDRMLNLTGEIVIAQGRLRRMIEKAEFRSGREILEMQSETERLFRDLQDEVMKVRMVPIGAMLRQNLRAVRDLANSHSKLARVEVTGEDVEVDTTVLEHLKDALLHMIRNAIDHGIETPPVRKKRGKNPCGLLKVSAAHVNGNVVVTLQDDGAGLNRAKILQKAKGMGLFLNSNPVSDSELYQVLFQPGFSTADSVTDLSGRGVGLDVVRRNVEALQGTVEIASEEGHGTAITIRLPLTLAIIDGFSVLAGNDTFIVPQQYIIECTELPAAQSQPGSSGILNLRGSALPFIRLREVFGQSADSSSRENVIVVKVGDFHAGIAVDHLLGGMQAVIKPLGKVFRGISGIAGSTILGDGRVGLIIDVPGLLQGMMQSSLQPQIG